MRRYRVFMTGFVHGWEDSRGRSPDDPCAMETVRYYFDPARDMDEQVEEFVRTLADVVRKMTLETVAA